ncbi:high-affinity choline transporter 1-like [Lingula anatina]|uniref:High-affinity choline transporter 1-like n=1 Tax=Lingula anatina TaxID=7574 RepID=A0A1S3I180_LINAN|nr:high-affinity choline transporter 1-like [Lingula anatina]|eukprot:XP_013392018.1 high-affinity choline transporter 1-like [Lingula anatina]
MEVISIVGLSVLIFLYIVILVVGIVAAKKFRPVDGSTDTEISAVAGRKINSVVGVFTMTATVVGGGFLNGTAESVASQGVIWTLAPFGIFLGLILGGLFFAKPMRDQRYLTMLDPFQLLYGDTVTGMLYITALCGDIFWSSSILAALGTSLSVIVDLDVTLSIIVSACVTVTYTQFGQMLAVAYTDIVQLVFIVVAMVISVPFALTHPSVGSIVETASEWGGELDASLGAAWVDLFIAMTLGSIPWQSYFQRVLSVKGSSEAQVLSVVGGVAALVMAVPPLLLGAVARSAEWNTTDLGSSPMDRNESSLVLPYVIHYFTPPAVAVIALGGVSAAVMSSADSSVLGSSSMFTHNIYNKVFRKKASEAELLWVQRITVVGVGVIATTMAIFVHTVYFLFILAADIVFVIILPQLICVVYLKKHTNTYGAIVGYIVGLLLRLGAGESFIHLPVFIKYPFYSETSGQLFPFRTFAMLVSLLTVVVVSCLAKAAFSKHVVSEKLDIFRCFADRKNVENSTSLKRNRAEDEPRWRDPSAGVSREELIQDRPNYDSYEMESSHL